MMGKRVRQGSGGGAGADRRPLIDSGDFLWLGFALIVGLGLRLDWILYVNVNPNDGRFDDSVFYHNVAHLLAMGAGYVDPWGGGQTAQWPPAFPAALAVLYKLFGWHMVLAKGLNLVFAGVTVLLTYIIARRLFDRRVAFLAALTLAMFPGQIFFSTLVLAETMFGMVFMLVLLLTLLWTVERPSSRWWQPLVIGVVVAVAALTRAEGAFLALILPVVWVAVVRPWRSVARYTALLALGFAIGLAPWTVRNALELHQFIPVRPDSTFAISDALDPTSDGPGSTFAERRTIGDSLSHYGTHPHEFVSLMGHKLQLFYNDDADGVFWTNSSPPVGVTPSDYKVLLTPDEANRWRRLADGYFFVVGAAAFVAGVVCLLRRNRASLLPLGAIIGWSLLFAFFNPTTRYHFPLGPLLSIFGAAFAVFVWDAVATYWPMASRAGAKQEMVVEADRSAGA